ncbi:3-keto-disaccharide hydrolase [Thalassotalea sp. PLHSN55]|uniref:3-keto-disaccharide hydrolase n=1 Tax=Thalassotalea sp. PLHSN55 TaxID=3435888 RepID=UPI003F82B926
MKRIIYIWLIGLVSLSCAVSANKIDPKVTEQWTPVPEIVTPGKIPSDAFSLFDGTDLDAWQDNHGKIPQWQIEQGVVTVSPGSGSIKTKQSFCNMQLHLEWRSPAKAQGKKGQKLGNSGIFMQGRYEVQVLDSYQNQTYSNGQAAAIYKQSAPMVNAMRPTGEWNSFDIIFTSPEFNHDKSLKTPAYVTVLHNGILVQNHFELQGRTVYRGKPSYQAHGCAPIVLQDHGDKVSYRNIWVREL